jgi:hypothetical protein
LNHNLDGVGHPGCQVGRDDHRAVPVGMNEVMMAHCEAENVNFYPNINDMDKGVAGTDFAAKQLKTGRDKIQVPDCPICYNSQAA